MFKRIAGATLAMAAALALFPAGASARDWDDHRYDRREDNREYREHLRREHERRERAEREYRFREYHQGYYDRFGYWHP